MALEAFVPPAKSLPMKKGSRKTDAHRIFDAMHGQMDAVYPADDAEAWSWTGEGFSEHIITPPVDDFSYWFSHTFETSDEFSQAFVQRMFTVWHSLEEEGFRANDHELYEHQKALFAWIALSGVTGVRFKMANLLIRSPYGSGKSLVAGLTSRAMYELQAEMIARGVDIASIPTGALLGLRREHMQQNALGQQYAVLQPPYTVERRDVNSFWQSLGKMYGDDFAGSFARPAGKQHPFYNLFPISDEAEHAPPVATRLQNYFEQMDSKRAASWKGVAPKSQRHIVDTLEALMEGRIVLVPDAYNVPQPEKPIPLADDQKEHGNRSLGYSAHALFESELYHVKTTHPHLALDRNAYTTQPNMEHPAHFCIAYGTMLTRDPELIRADVREEIMRRLRFMALDEAGKYNPLSVTDSAAQASGQPTLLLGFTGQDRGIDGWTARSPVLSIRQMIRLGLMKPIAFSGIGDARHPVKQGTEEAWDVYRDAMFRDEKTASTLHLPQAHELDTVVVPPAGHVREYAHRIIEAHKEEGKPVKVWAFDPEAGDNRWGIIANGFNAPKKEGDSRRVLVAPPSQISEALHLGAECYDVLTNVQRHALDQMRGRLGHIRNTGASERERKNARTHFRMQWLRDAPGEAYVRDMAQKMGYKLDDEGATWKQQQCMIDAEAHDRDQKRKGMSAPESIPDIKAIQMRKTRKQSKAEGTPLKPTSSYVIAREAKKSEREVKRSLKRALELPSVMASLPPASVATSETTTRLPTESIPLHLATNPHLRIDTTPSVKLLEYSATVRKKGKGKSAKQREISVTIIVGPDGMPTNLGTLANIHGIGAYANNLMRKSREELANDVQKAALAKVVAQEILRLQQVVEDRKNGGTKKPDADSSGHYIGVKLVR